MNILSREHITDAVVHSEDDGETINFANFGFTEVSEAAAEELARVGKKNDDDAGIVARCVSIAAFPINVF